MQLYFLYQRIIPVKLHEISGFRRSVVKAFAILVVLLAFRDNLEYGPDRLQRNAHDQLTKLCRVTCLKEANCFFYA
jgi:hypothetical protein